MRTETWELVENPTRYDDYNWASDAVPARKFYLFIAEIGRRLRHLMTDPGPIKMIDLCEQCAEGQIPEDELSDLSDENRPTSPSQPYHIKVANNLYSWVADWGKVNARSVYYAVDAFAALAAVTSGLLPSEAQFYEDTKVVRGHPIFDSVRDATALEWGALIRDIYGLNPFHPIAIKPAWLTSTALSIATRSYDERSFDGLPILADALEDAGCDNSAILAHCRNSGPHVRGCWVLDLLTGRS